MAPGLGLVEEHRPLLCSPPPTRELRTGCDKGHGFQLHWKGQGESEERGTAARLKTGHTKRGGGRGYRHAGCDRLTGNTQKSETGTFFQTCTFFFHKVGLGHDAENVLILDVC